MAVAGADPGCGTDCASYHSMPIASCMNVELAYSPARLGRKLRHVSQVLPRNPVPAGNT